MGWSAEGYPRTGKSRVQYMGAGAFENPYLDFERQLSMTSEHPDCTTLPELSAPLALRKRASHFEEDDHHGAKRRHPDDPSGDGSDTLCPESKRVQETHTHHSDSCADTDESDCVLRLRASKGPFTPDQFSSDFEGPAKDLDQGPGILLMSIPVTYEWHEPGQGRCAEGVLDSKHTDDLLAVLLESLHPDKCPPQLFNTISRLEAPFPSEIGLYVRETAETWYESHVKLHAACSADYLASRRKRLLDGFERAGALPEYVIQPDTGESGIFYNRFSALNSTDIAGSATSTRRSRQ